MKKFNFFKTCALLLIVAFSNKVYSQMTIINHSPSNSITCTNSNVSLSVVHTFTTGPVTINWTNGVVTYTTNSINVTAANAGIYTVTAFVPPGIVDMRVIAVPINTTIPLSSVSPMIQMITCVSGAQSTTLVAQNPTVNITQEVVSPFGGVFVATTRTVAYLPGGPGTYTHHLINLANGCKVTKSFTVFSSSSFPTFSLQSNTGYTLGCGSKSITTVNITSVVASPTNASVTYAIVAPGTSTFSYNTITSKNINSPGTWTVFVSNNNNNCETISLFSILQNTVGPIISVNTPTHVLTCANPSVNLVFSSTSSNATYSWTNLSGATIGNTITVNTIPAQQTYTQIGIYTLAATSMDNLCTSTTVVPMYQQLTPPLVSASFVGSVQALTCANPSLVLQGSATQGTQTLRAGWNGQALITPTFGTLNHTVTAGGNHTFMVQDPNNGCSSQTVIMIIETKPTLNIIDPKSTNILCPYANAVLYPTVPASVATAYTYTWTTTTGIITTHSLLVNSPGIYTLTVKDPITTCTQNVLYQVTVCADIVEDLKLNKIRIYPNPNNGEFTLEVTTDLTASITNIMGQTVKQEQLHEGKNTMNLYEQPKGVYFIRMGDGKKTYNKKIVVE